MKDPKKLTRREFLSIGAGALSATALGGLFFSLSGRTAVADTVWQIDPEKCNQCGRCQTECVILPSAVKCVNQFKVCGYCDLCSGYLKPYAPELGTQAEYRVCPTSALKRTFIEEPYFQYTIDEPLCIACGKCVKGCAEFGNGSLFLQVRHDRCLNCNDCAIARVCPTNAIKRVPATNPYILKGG
jgi:electron transport complex protein RnfB